MSSERPKRDRKPPTPVYTPDEAALRDRSHESRAEKEADRTGPEALRRVPQAAVRELRRDTASAAAGESRRSEGRVAPHGPRILLLSADFRRPNSGEGLQGPGSPLRWTPSQSSGRFSQKRAPKLHAELDFMTFGS